MKNTIVLGSISLVSFFAAAAPARADVPAWCSAIGQNRIDRSQDLTHALDDNDPRNALKEIVGDLCKPDEAVTARLKDFDAARAKWSERLDLTEADWADVAAYATLGQGPRMNGEVRIDTKGREIGIGEGLKRAWSSFDPIDQFAMLNADAGPSGDMSLDHDYLADALGAKLSETGRLSYVRRCINNRRTNAVAWAMCQGDIDALDWKKLADELRDNKVYGGADKVRIRIIAAEVKAELPDHADQVKKLMASDPGYAKLFDIAAATRKEWVGRVKSDAALLDLALAMDDARATNSRKAFAGCDDTTWAAWKTAMASVPAKKFTGMHSDRENGKSILDQIMGPIVASPDLYLASVALNTCRTVGAEKRARADILVRALGDSLTRWPGFRGPRTATETAIMGAGIELDDRDAKLDFPGVNRSFRGGGGTRSGGGEGVVGSLKPTGPVTTLEFKKQMVKQQQCAQAKSTHRITQIRPDGTLIYESICTKWETVTVDKSDMPQKINPRYLAGIKPGMYVSTIEDVLVAAWAKPGAAAPSMIFDVPVK